MAVTWDPIHPEHAIERARVSVQFGDKLPHRTIQKLGEAFEKQRVELGFGPRLEVQTHTLMVALGNPSSPTVTQQARGWQFVRETSPGAVLEAIILDPEGLFYENVEYVRWQDFWSRASQIVLPLIDGVAEVTDLRLFALEYFDRFVFSGSPSKASPETLIQKHLTATVSEAARSGEELWHIHRGWYETVKGVRVLVNQNIDSSDVQNLKGEQVRTVGVYTKVERREKTEIVDASQLGKEMVTLHSISKAVFASAIDTDVQAKIGLNDGTRA